MGKQGHGRRLTDKERMEIIELTRQNPRIKHVELATKYSVNESTIRKWRQKANADKIETRYESGVEAARDVRQRGQAVKNAAFDTTMYEWICSMRSQSIDLPPVKIREKARQLAESYDGMQDFKASSGWYYRFCRRYGLPCPSSKREADASLSAGNEAVVAATEDADAAAGDLQSAVIAESEPERAISALHESHAEHTTNEESGTVVLNGSLAEPTDAPSVFDAASYEPMESISTSVAGKRKFDDTIGGNNSGENVNESGGGGVPDTIATPPKDDVAPVANDPSTRFLAPATSTSQLTTRQEAIAHFLHYHKDLLSVPSRLRFIKHLAHVAGEAEMYSVMDDETRIELIKEFVDKDDSASIPVGAESEGLVV
uniref:HTH CENPB-type domain-containing protein n=1 Tax=Globisporangium ultimum (strain ATCC 200006 / CBS 805.95 / DAOM BR144) TaxID=431595 RepID=K3WHK6_GLOUD